MESTFKVPLTKILAIDAHPAADRLALATVYGFQVVIPLNSYNVGDLVVYFPIDSILSEKVEALLFDADSKIKLNKRRIRQIRIRKFPSQGMLCKPETLSSIVNPKYLKEEQDLAAILGVEKYEPEPPQEQGVPSRNKMSRKALAHPDFHSYNGLGNIKWFPNVFAEGELVVVQEKLHGTNARAAKLSFRANTLMKKLKKFLGLAPIFENLYGSNKVDITNSSGYKGWYGDDIYGAVFSKIGAFDKIIMNNMIIYGEIVGPGIQKGYDYGLKEHKFVLFDMKVLNDVGEWVWIQPDKVRGYAETHGFDFVPVLYEGPFNKALITSLCEGASVFGTEKVREGCVVKAARDYDVGGNKKALKVINPKYLDDTSNSDNH